MFLSAQTDMSTRSVHGEAAFRTQPTKRIDIQEQIPKCSIPACNRPLILQLNNDMRSELWQASGGDGSRAVISQRNYYRGRLWEKTPLEERGWAKGKKRDTGSSQRKTTLATTDNRQSRVCLHVRSSAFCSYFFCLFVCFFRFCDVGEQDFKIFEHTVASMCSESPKQNQCRV